MKKPALFVLCLSASMSTHAQLAVIDPANIAENIRQLVQLELQYARQLEELVEAQRKVEAITGNYGLGANLIEETDGFFAPRQDAQQILFAAKI